MDLRKIKALIDLWLATGTLLDHFGIVLEDEPASRVSPVSK